MNASHFIDWDQPQGRIQKAICGAPATKHTNEPTCLGCVAILAARAIDEAEAEASLNDSVDHAGSMPTPSPLYGSTQGYRPRGYEIANERTERRR